MIHILDTNICIYFLNGNEKLAVKMERIGVGNLAVTYGVLAELYFGAYNSGKTAQNIKRINEFIENITVLNESNESAQLFGKIKSELKSKGKIIDDFDILLSSIAMAESGSVVTNNVRHFKIVKGLKYENWLT